MREILNQTNQNNIMSHPSESALNEVLSHNLKTQGITPKNLQLQIEMGEF